MYKVSWKRKVSLLSHDSVSIAHVLVSVCALVCLFNFENANENGDAIGFAFIMFFRA